MKGRHSFYIDDEEQWSINDQLNDKIHGLKSNSSRNIFPPTNWTVWNKDEKKWIPANVIKIVTDGKYEPCKKIAISLNGTPSRNIIKKALGDYLPTNEYANGRTVFKQKKNPKLKLQVDVRYDAWVVLDGADVPILRSAAAGDMNPASERNNHCKTCSTNSGKMSSWAYFIGPRYNETLIEVDKIKVSCENEDELHGIGKGSFKITSPNGL